MNKQIINSNKKILIFSNCAASATESNGRIHMTHFQRFSNIFNFYVTGNPDCDQVTYFTVPYKSAFFSKITFGLFKPHLLFGKRLALQHQTVKKNNKIPFNHWARNFCFKNNKRILSALENFIKDNEINIFVLWGSNVPFLYEYVNRLSKKLNIPFITITSEDYPLKKYNYINNKRSLCFNVFQMQLKRNCVYSYKNSKCNIYTNDDLKKHYEDEIGCSNDTVIYFGSDLKPSKENNKAIKNIIYGGKLYDDRINSLIDIANALKANDDIKIKVFGHISDKDKLKFKYYKNIHFYGFIDYDSLIKETYNADALLHIEGFSEYYIKDCRYAFSTKISDYIMINKPFIVYGPKEISGVRFYSKIQPDWCFTSKKELCSLSKILKTNEYDTVNLSNLFSSNAVSKKIEDILNKL